ncbi:MAG: PAS domain-containing protein [Methylocystis sp.]|nr:PAS domain-containing protein [Methylocystis sp.]
MNKIITPTDKEVFFPEDELIVSKTDPKGRITYANQTFCHVCGYSEAELLGQPHSIVRHPDMPRAVFKLLWDTLFDRREIFAYVKNMTKNGDYYWVFAHATPSYDKDRNIVGFHSSRRFPKRSVVDNTIAPLYAAILQEEKQHRNGQKALTAGFDFVVNFLKSRNTTYDELIISISL